MSYTAAPVSRRRRRRRVATVGTTLAALTAALMAAGPAEAATPRGGVVEFGAGIPVHSEPHDIVTGADGNLWVAEPRGDTIARVTPAGRVTQFYRGIPVGSRPTYVAAGADGNIWFTEHLTNRVARITPAGVVTEFPAGPAAGSFGDLTTGPDGNLWYTKKHAIGRVATDGSVTEFSAGLANGSLLSDITPGPDGNLWFTDYYAGVGWITPAGAITEYSLGGDRRPGGITTGPDGNLWFTDDDASTVNRLTTGLVLTSFPVAPATGPHEIVMGPDRALWFTAANNRIGRITTAGVLTVYAAGITKGANPIGITAGPDGNVWFTELSTDAVARIGAGASGKVPAMACARTGGLTRPTVKVVCTVSGLRRTATVGYQVARKDSGGVVVHGRKALRAGTLTIDLTRVPGLRSGRYQVMVTKGSGATRVVMTRMVSVG